MRRALLLLFLSGFVLSTGSALPTLAHRETARQQIIIPGTNTPAPTAFIFATNTPSGPTATPTATNTPTASPSPTITNTPSPTPIPFGPDRYPEGINSLTGLEFPSEEAQNRRNLLVKISNYPPIVRPQSGLNRADIVYEYEVEGGVTRFAAIYRSDNPDHVGPVRSGRLLDFRLVPMYQALFAYSGSSEPIRQMALASPWGYQILSPQFGDNCEEAGFCRFPQDGLPFEHTLYLDTNAAWARAERRNVNVGYPARGFTFDEIPTEGGKIANEVFVNWYGHTDARWQYDSATQRYVRYTESVPHYDAGDGEQLWTDNVIVIEVPHEDRPDLFEPESRSSSQDILLIGTGRAYIFRDGQYWEGVWERRNENEGTALRLFFGNYNDIALRPGRSYVQVVRWLGDVKMSVEQSDMIGTATQVALSATPTPTPSATPAQ